MLLLSDYSDEQEQEADGSLLRFYCREMDWFRCALRVIPLPTSQIATVSVKPCACGGCARQAWMSRCEELIDERDKAELWIAHSTNSTNVRVLPSCRLAPNRRVVNGAAAQLPSCSLSGKACYQLFKSHSLVREADFFGNCREIRFFIS